MQTIIALVQTGRIVMIDMQLLENVCAAREQYLDVLKRRVNRKLFHAQKYKDEQSYQEHAESLKLYNMLKCLLDTCAQKEDGS